MSVDVTYTDHATLDSSVVKEVHYNRDDSELFVTLAGNTVYRYDAVPASYYNDLKNAKSAGSYYNTIIKSQFGPATYLGNAFDVYFDEDWDDEDYEDEDDFDYGDPEPRDYGQRTEDRYPSWRDTAVNAVKDRETARSTGLPVVPTPQVALRDVTKSREVTYDSERALSVERKTEPTPQVRLNRGSVPVNGAPKYRVSVEYEIVTGKSEKFTTTAYDVTGAVDELNELLHTLGLSAVAKSAVIYFE